jgi:acetolactate synthase-1/2/3 large subunit
MRGRPVRRGAGAEVVAIDDQQPGVGAVSQAFGCVGLRAEHPGELDDKIREMIEVRKPVIFDCRVTKEENCFPMIPSGKAHNEMIMAEESRDLGSIIDEAGKRLV